MHKVCKCDNSSSKRYVLDFVVLTPNTWCWLTLLFADTVREGTLVLWTADALAEPMEMIERPLRSSAPWELEYSSSSSSSQHHHGEDQELLWYRTSFTWNLTRPPAMPIPSSTAPTGGIGAGIYHSGSTGAAMTATTLFLMISGKSIGQGVTKHSNTHEESHEALESRLLWEVDLEPVISFR